MRRDLCAVCIADSLNSSAITFYDTNARPMSLNTDERIALLQALDSERRVGRRGECLADYPGGRALPFFAVTTVQDMRVCALHAAERAGRGR